MHVFLLNYYVLFIFLPYFTDLFHLTRFSSTMLTRSVECGHLCLSSVSGREKSLNISPLNFLVDKRTHNQTHKVPSFPVFAESSYVWMLIFVIYCIYCNYIFLIYTFIIFVEMIMHSWHELNLVIIACHFIYH